MKKGQNATQVKEAFGRIADRYVMANHVLSGGVDILWRRKVARIVAGWEPEKILDVASGTGDLALEIQKKCLSAELVATDFSPEMLAHAGRRGVRQTLLADALSLPFEDQSFDVVTVAFGLRNMADWEKGLREMVRVIRDGGCLLVLDFSKPKGLLGKPYQAYLQRFLPRAAGLLTGHRDAYSYLAESIQSFPEGRDMLELFEKVGMTNCEERRLTGGIATIYTGIV